MCFKFSLRPKKSSLVSRNWPGESFFYYLPAHIVECISEYIFLIKKNKIKIKTRKQKAKDTKEEKITFVENLTGYDDIVHEFALRTSNLFDRVVNFYWLFI